MKKVLLGVFFSVFALALPALADNFQNESFERGDDPGSFTKLDSGDDGISGWDIKSGSVDYIGSYWDAAEGDRSIDLNGNEKGSISQTFNTEDDKIYKVAFHMSGNPDVQGFKKLSISADDSAKRYYGFDTEKEDNSKEDMKWKQYVYYFVASGSETTLTFASEIDGAWGPALDDISIEELDIDSISNKNDCKKGGWESFGFRNQGQCVSSFNHSNKNHGKYVRKANNKKYEAHLRNGMPEKSRGHFKLHKNK